MSPTSLPIPMWMAWNTVLALVPLGLALVLFRDAARVHRTLAWWVMLVGFLLLLPNAPYVLTDVIHLTESRDGPHPLLLRTVVLYSVFFTVGVLAYTIAVARLGGYLRRCDIRLAIVAAVEAALHVACAAGVLLGRFGRWNSWDAAFRPAAVVQDSSWLLAPRSVAAVLLLAGFFAAVTATLRLAMVGARAMLRAGSTA